MLEVLTDSDVSDFYSDNDSSGTDDLAVCALSTVEVLLKVVMLFKVLLHCA
jgi:hypothetical protein